MALPRGALQAMGAKGRSWMARDFSWDRVAQEMIGVYLWVAGRAAPAPMIRFD